MLPTFPNFVKLDISHKNDIDAITSKYPPYNDFLFTNLYSWDVDSNFEICELHGNLVVYFKNYVGVYGDFISFLGDGKPLETINEIFIYLKRKNLALKLKLVPEVAVVALAQYKQHTFEIAEDRDSHDYILDVPDLARLSGKKFEDHKTLVNRFNRATKSYSFVQLDLSKKYVQQEILNLFKIWEKNKNINSDEYKTEYYAISKMSDLAQQGGFLAHAIYVDGLIIAFSLNEIFNKEYALAHFRKGNIQFPGVYRVLEQEVNKLLSLLGIKYLNFEQDLGIENLRTVKLAWRPKHFLKKYTVQAT